VGRHRAGAAGMNHDRHWIEPLSGIHGPEVESLRRGEVVTLRVSEPWWPFPRLLEFERRDLKKWVAKKAVVQGEGAPW